MGSNSMLCYHWNIHRPFFVTMDDIGAYQGIIGIIRRLWDQHNVFALALGEMMGANIYHNLGSGHNFGRYVLFKVAGVLATCRR